MVYVSYPLTSRREFQNEFSNVAPTLLPGILNSMGLKQTPVDVTTASYTLTNDPSHFFLMNSASAQTFNLPQNLDKWEVGSVLTIIQLGAGLVTLDPGTNVTVNGDTTNVASAGRYKALQLIKVGTNAWIVFGGAA